MSIDIAYLICFDTFRTKWGVLVDLSDLIYSKGWRGKEECAHVSVCRDCDIFTALRLLVCLILVVGYPLNFGNMYI